MTAVFTHALVALGWVTGTAFSQQAQVSHHVLVVSPPQGNQSNIGVCGDGAWSSPLAFLTARSSLLHRLPAAFSSHASWDTAAPILVAAPGTMSRDRRAQSPARASPASLVPVPTETPKPDT